MHIKLGSEDLKPQLPDPALAIAGVMLWLCGGASLFFLLSSTPSYYFRNPALVHQKKHLQKANGVRYRLSFLGNVLEWKILNAVVRIS